MSSAVVHIAVVLPAGTYDRRFEVPLGLGGELTADLVGVYMRAVTRDLAGFIEKHSSGKASDVPGQLSLPLARCPVDREPLPTPAPPKKRKAKGIA